MGINMMRTTILEKNAWERLSNSEGRIWTFQNLFIESLEILYTLIAKQVIETFARSFVYISRTLGAE